MITLRPMLEKDKVLYNYLSVTIALTAKHSQYIQFVLLGFKIGYFVEAYGDATGEAV